MLKIARHGAAADRGGDFFRRRGRAVRALLGRRRQLSQPAFRDLLLPGHRILHRARAARASNPAPRASTRCRAASCRRSPVRRTDVVDARFAAAIRDFAAREARGVDQLRGGGQRARALPPGARRGVASLSRLVWLGEHADPEWFPPLEQALRDPPGLLAAGGDLRPARLLAAYERGVFPWYSAQQPILWWSPDPRMVLFPERIQVYRAACARRCATARYATRAGSGVRRDHPRLRGAAPLGRRHLAESAR